MTSYLTTNDADGTFYVVPPAAWNRAAFTNKRFLARTVSLKLRYAGFKTITCAQRSRPPDPIYFPSSIRSSRVRVPRRVPV